jgi:hypothetical protein
MTEAGERAGRGFIEFFTANIPLSEHAHRLRLPLNVRTATPVD